MIYITLIAIAVALIGLEILNNRKRKLRVSRKNKLELNLKFVDRLDNFLSKFHYLFKLKESYIKKLSVISNNKRSHNNAISVLAVYLSIIITVLVSMFLMSFMNMWYVVLVIGLLVFYLINYGFYIYLGVKLKKIYSQFPIAIQMFTDTYITNKNIKAALNESYKSMPNEVGLVFEKLARSLSSGYEYEKDIKEFADNLSYVWAYAFSELLLMSFEGSGDISDDLLFLNELINDDMQDDEESKAEMATNKMIFMVINGCTLLAFILNAIYSDVAKELYFYTTTGNTIIMAWIIVIAIGITASSVLDHV